MVNTVARPGTCPVTGVPWSEFRYNSPEVGQNPELVCDALLEAGPVRSEAWDGYWILSRYDDVMHVYQNPEIFSSFPNSIPAPDGSDGGLGAVGKLIPIEIDPPDHASYRRILAPPFSPSTVNNYAPWVRTRCEELVRAFIERGGGDFMEDFATPLPGELWCKLMNVPTEDAPKALKWADDIMHGDPTAADSGLAIRQQAGMEVYVYLTAVMEERRKNPGDDIVSLLLSAKFDGGRDLDDMEILNTCFFLLMAGLDTTRGVLGSMISYLAVNPDKRRELSAGPGITREALEELLRIASPIGPGRTLTQDAEVGGVQMRKGEHVLLMTHAAGRDPRMFEAPDMVDFTRKRNRHMAFGAGIHRCTGSHLARMELKIALEVIHELMPDYYLKPGAELKWAPFPVRGLDELHIVVGTP